MTCFEFHSNFEELFLQLLPGLMWLWRLYRASHVHHMYRASHVHSITSGIMFVVSWASFTLDRISLNINYTPQFQPSAHPSAHPFMFIEKKWFVGINTEGVVTLAQCTRDQCEISCPETQTRFKHIYFPILPPCDTANKQQLQKLYAKPGHQNQKLFLQVSSHCSNKHKQLLCGVLWWCGMIYLSSFLPVWTQKPAVVFGVRWGLLVEVAGSKPLYIALEKRLTGRGQWDRKSVV